MEATYSYTEHAAQERFEPGADGLSVYRLDFPARAAAYIAGVFGDLHRRAVQRRIGNDARNRRDAREQFQARMAAI